MPQTAGTVANAAAALKLPGNGEENGVLPWVELGRAKVPGGGEFRLMQRGD